MGKRINMASYRQDTMEKDACEPCRPDIKALKKRLKENKERLEDFIVVTAYVDMDYNERNKYIGNLYMDRIYIKKDILEAKRALKKTKGKK